MVLIHLVQALTRLPLARRTHCRLGYFLFLVVGLYLPRSFLRTVATIDFLPQIAHRLAIIDYHIISIINYQALWKPLLS